MKLRKSLAERLSGSIICVKDTIAIKIVTYQDDKKINNRMSPCESIYKCDSFCACANFS